MKTEVLINGVKISRFKSLSVVNTMTSFSDTISLSILEELATPLLWDTVYKGAEVVTNVRGVQDKFIIQGIETSFRKKDAVSIQIIGVSEQYSQAKDQVDPKTYFGVTDNEVIQEMFPGSSFDLDAAHNIEKLSIDREASRLSVADKAAAQGGYVLFVSGGTIFKRKAFGTTQSTKIYSDSPESSHNKIYGNVNISTSMLDNVYSTIKAYGVSNSYDQLQGEYDNSLTDFFTGSAIPLTRTKIINSDAKNYGEIESVMQDSAYKLKPKTSVSFEVRGRDDLNLNEVATVKCRRFSFGGSMYLYKKQFNQQSDGHATTTLYFSPVGYHY